MKLIDSYLGSENGRIVMINFVLFFVSSFAITYLAQKNSPEDLVSGLVISLFTFVYLVMFVFDFLLFYDKKLRNACAMSAVTILISAFIIIFFFEETTYWFSIIPAAIAWLSTFLLTKYQPIREESMKINLYEESNRYKNSSFNFKGCRNLSFFFSVLVLVVYLIRRPEAVSTLYLMAALFIVVFTLGIIFQILKKSEDTKLDNKFYGVLANLSGKEATIIQPLYTFDGVAYALAETTDYIVPVMSFENGFLMEGTKVTIKEEIHTCDEFEGIIVVKSKSAETSAPIL